MNIFLCAIQSYAYRGFIRRVFSYLHLFRGITNYECIREVFFRRFAQWGYIQEIYLLWIYSLMIYSLSLLIGDSLIGIYSEDLHIEDLLERFTHCMGIYSGDLLIIEMYLVDLLIVDL